ncbi:universal stress protein [Alloacidobacterium dinghuense]|uniref:Universal stress protein n=1 Tax=Alloacidobacterium dinghuense TaxID=2763107 RepID=A0A7G8BNZ6_9BACT|nr:universal stress protein [Alloacidobacterium dinghuense]QNI34266.1 universal stress protein [Alloacidobacterium dinghuense]
MSRVEKILFPVNFSASCRAMGAYVKRAAALSNATVTLVHVIDPGDLDIFEQYELYVRPAADIVEDHRAIRSERLTSFLAAEFPITNSPRVLLIGDPATEISNLASEGSFDLIIMPTHAGRFRQTLLGSTTARVINDAPCPVLTSRHAETIAPRPLTHKEWICALDLSPYSEMVLRTGKTLSEQAGAALSLMHVVDVGKHRGRSSSGETDDFHLAEIRDATNAMNTLQSRFGLSIPSQVVAGSLKNSLIEAITQSDIDVLIIGRSSSGGSRGRLTDLTYALIRDSPFAVLSV